MPFTAEQFLRVFESYNRAVYPAQWVLILLALAAVLLAIKPPSFSSRLVAILLAALWAWTGIAYHLEFFTQINNAAYLFGLLFVAQAALFLLTGLLRGKLVFRAKPDVAGVVGGLLIVFALLLYPALGLLSSHVYPRAPTFGTPCPVTIFTFGLLLWTDKSVPLYVLLIPFVWSLLGSSAAFLLDVREDIGLLGAGVVGTFLIAAKRLTLHVREG